MSHHASGLGRQVRAAFVTALLLPYLLIQSIAAGVMPVVTDGGLTFVICSGERISGQSTRAEHGRASGDHDGPHADGGVCPWAVAHAPGALADVPEVSAFVILSRTVAADEAGQARPFARTILSPPARAPPAEA